MGTSADMTGKNKELRWPNMPRIKHPFRLAAIMTCELLMVYEAVCYPGSPMALMFTVMQIMLTGLAYFWSRARVRMPYHKDVIGRLIGEVYANISRHASSGGKYEVSVLVKTHSLEITEVNDMGARHSGSLPGGHGLRQFAAEIEHIGGSLSTDCENGIWMFHARIPFD